MATTEECRGALDTLSDNLARADDDGVRSAAALDRSLSCHITDLDITFTGRLADGRIDVRDLHDGPPRERAEIRLAMTGDDLVAMVDGELNFARAWASGRVRLEAGFRDLIRLRKLL
ncbi:SCP2 sterol-binding domain-containing protein [Streptomyces albidochromogenes]|uniref:SCP2 sterol-binding domain-containing protein n=1 Tax=Streptomyces albidochromogenes TaxID=329524 RepID=A0ABW6FLL8_9ACTN